MTNIKLSVSVCLSPKMRLKRALKEAGVENPASVSKLTVSGIITKNDFRFIHNNMAKTLTELDMSDATIKNNIFPDWDNLGCSGLISICFPKTVEKISRKFIKSQRNLCKIVVHPDNSVYESDDGVLFNKGKTKLILYPEKKQGDYVIPDSVIEIENDAFYLCINLTSVVIPDSVKKIGKKAFTLCIGLTSIIIPNSIKEISNYLFHRCYGLTSIIIPDSVSTIGNSAFDNCPKLTSIVIPQSVKKIGYRAFFYCTGLTSVVFNYADGYAVSNSLKKIDFFTFEGCIGLTSIVIPNCIKEISYGAFLGCTSLKSVYIPASVVKIFNNAFRDCPAFFSVHPDNPVYASENGKLINK